MCIYSPLGDLLPQNRSPNSFLGPGFVVANPIFTPPENLFFHNFCITCALFWDRFWWVWVGLGSGRIRSGSARVRLGSGKAWIEPGPIWIGTCSDRSRLGSSRKQFVLGPVGPVTLRACLLPYTTLEYFGRESYRLRCIRAPCGLLFGPAGREALRTNHLCNSLPAVSKPKSYRVRCVHLSFGLLLGPAGPAAVVYTSNKSPRQPRSGRFRLQQLYHARCSGDL